MLTKRRFNWSLNLLSQDRVLRLFVCPCGGDEEEWTGPREVLNAGSLQSPARPLIDRIIIMIIPWTDVLLRLFTLPKTRKRLLEIKSGPFNSLVIFWFIAFIFGSFQWCFNQMIIRPQIWSPFCLCFDQVVLAARSADPYGPRPRLVLLFGEEKTHDHPRVHWYFFNRWVAQGQYSPFPGHWRCSCADKRIRRNRCCVLLKRSKDKLCIKCRQKPIDRRG